MSLTKTQHDLIDNFLRESTLNFDSSHNWEHGMVVYNNTLNILTSEKIEYEDDIITLASKLHDVCDHKYPQSISKQDLINFIKTIVNDDKTNRIIKIIDNVSYSKEVAGKREILESPDDLYLTVISDADRLEAIGEIGIKRCEDFTRARSNFLKNSFDLYFTEHNVTENVVQHCHDKLLRLYNDHFIKTESARKLAEPLHQVIVDYVKRFEINKLAPKDEVMI